jgi:hypothetical protein
LRYLCSMVNGHGATVANINFALFMDQRGPI